LYCIRGWVGHLPEITKESGCRGPGVSPKAVEIASQNPFWDETWSKPKDSTEVPWGPRFAHKRGEDTRRRLAWGQFSSVRGGQKKTKLLGKRVQGKKREKSPRKA